MKISLIKSQLCLLLLSGSVLAADSARYSLDSEVLRELKQYLPLQHSQPDQSQRATIQATIGSTILNLESNLVESKDLCKPDVRPDLVAKLKEIADQIKQSEELSDLSVESGAAPLRILFFKELAKLIKLNKLSALSLVLNNGDCNNFCFEELRAALPQAQNISRLEIQAYHHVADIVRPVFPFYDSEELLSFLQAAPQCELTISHDGKLDFLKTLGVYGFKANTPQSQTFEQENLSGELPRSQTVAISRI